MADAAVGVGVVPAAGAVRYRAPERPGGNTPLCEQVSGAALKAAFNMGKQRGLLGDRPEHNPWLMRADVPGRKYAAAWANGRRQGEMEMIAVRMEL